VAWLLLSVTLARGTNPEQSQRLARHVSIQALLSIGMIAESTGLAAPAASSWAGRQAFPLTDSGFWSGLLLLNISLVKRELESTYVALSARWRRAFSPAVLGVIFLLRLVHELHRDEHPPRAAPLWDVANPPFRSRSFPW